MVFEEIVLENFATYKGENSINLLPSSPEKPIILVGGENGCGKTTLLDAFQLVLFGPAARCSNRGKLTYERYLERCINRNTPPEDGARLKLTFHFHTGGEKKRYKIERRWFKRGKKLEEQFWVSHLSNEGIKYERALAENWADYIEGFFPSQVAPFFLFDGEKIEELADFEKSGTLVHAAIHSLLGLNLVDQLETDLLVYGKRKHREIASDEDQKATESLEIAITEFKQRIENLKMEEGQLNNQLDNLQGDLDKIEVQFRQQGGELFLKQSELEGKLSESQSILCAQEDKLREIAAGAAPLLLVKDLLQNVQAQAHKEEIANREKLLCETLEERDKALISKFKDLNAQQGQLDAIAQYLLSDRISRRKATEIEFYLNLDPEGQKALEILIGNELPSLDKEIPETLKQAGKMREDVEAIERSLAGVPDEANISKIIADREVTQKKIKEVETSLAVNKEEIERAQRQLEQKNSELRRELIRAAHHRFEGKDTRRMIQYSAKVRGTLELFREKVVAKHIDRIEGLVLNSFKNLLRKNSLIAHLKIDRETYQVRLYKENAKEVLPERLSAGERQLLATALLWGICQAAGKPLPTIIDTPLGRLDTSHRTNLVKNYFPFASHQVLLLSTDEEIVGKYHDKLNPYISHTAVLCHNEKLGGTTIQQGYFF